MDDFTSATMIRLIGAGLAAQGLPGPALPDTGEARVPLEAKRALLGAVLDRHGPLALLRIGAAARDLAVEPARAALQLARDPADLIERWQRLERYVHSRHRTTAETQDGTWTLHHIARSGPPPVLAEHLLVFGLLTALIGQLPGPVAVRASLGGGGFRFDGQGWTGRGHGAACDRLSLRITGQPPRPAPVATVSGETLPRATALLHADPSRAWTLQRLASDLHLSPRSLQRRLAAENAGFAALLGRVRSARSAELLTETAAPTAEIGYACGFSDQAHFTRTFRRFTAMTPGVFRREFAAAPSARAPSA